MDKMIQDKPILTIAIPTYNGKETISQMLDVLLPQVDSRVEVLISDNCSDQESSDIIKQYLLKNPYIEYVRNTKNIGADANFLQCLKKARGKYVLLLSDDDVLVEGALSRILSFLENSEEMSLVYLGTSNFYVRYKKIDDCVAPTPIPQENLSTVDKIMFMKSAKHYWGFVSSFIVLKSKFDVIENPEKYYGTYWLQSYIHIHCAKGDKTLLGVVGGINIAAGVYIHQTSLDIAVVDGINYRRMLDFAIDSGFDKKQLDKWYIDRLSLLARHGLVKEKAVGSHYINKRLLFKITKKYLKSWYSIYPFYFIPAFACKIVVGIKRLLKGSSFKAGTNREGDVKSEGSI